MMRLRNLLFGLFAIFVIELRGTPPTGVSFTVPNGPFQGLVHIFSTSDFGYSDLDGDPLVSIRVPGLPTDGILYVDADDNDTFDVGEQLLAGESVQVADLDVGNLQFISTGTANTSFSFEVFDGELSTSVYTATLNITPVPTVSISLDSSSETEPVGSTILRVTLSNEYGANVTTNLDFSGTATLNSDYTISNSSVEILAGSTTSTITIGIADDFLVEGNESIVINIGSIVNGNENVGQEQTLTVVDDDQATLSIASTTQSSEDATDGLFTISTDKQFASSVEVSFSVGGTAESGVDYTSLGTSITFAANTSSVTLPVPVIADDLVEGEETVVVTLTGTDHPDVLVGVTDAATVTITDDDQATLSISSTTQSSEDATDGLFTLSTDKQFASSVEVSFTVGGTAEIGVDYTSLGTSITFAANTSSVTLPVPVIADDLVEGEETVVVTLTGTDHPDVLVGVTDAATVTITDDDQATLSIASTTQSSEDATDGLFTLSTDKQFASSVEVSFTVGGTAEIGVDYTSLGTSITFAANTSSVTLPVPVIADDLVEGEETVVVTLTGTDHPDVLVGVTDAATVTITDDDQATLSISSTTQSSEDATDGLFTISTDKQFGSSVEVSFSVGGTAESVVDYTSLGTSITFAANTSSVTLPVPVIADDLVEGEETVVVTLTGTDHPDVLVGVTDAATVTITDDDQATLSISSTTQSSEDATDGLFTISTDKQFASSVEVSFTVGGTAEIGVDYTSLGTSITFAANTSSVTLPVPVIADDLVEGEETVVVTLTGTDHPDVLVGVTDAATVTITDDDQATLSIASTTQSSEDATDGLFTLSTDKQFASSVEVSFTVGGTAEIGVDYTSLGTSITFAANTSSVTLPVPVIADDLVEGEETVVVTLTGTDHPDVLVGVTDAATVTITDDDQATLSIASTTQSSEDATDGLFTISTDKQFASSVEVSFTVGGTAINGIDYTSIGNQILFPANQSTITVPVDVLSDDNAEGDETVILTLTGTDNDNIEIGSNDEATVIITDNDVAALYIAATTQAAEDNTDGLFTIWTSLLFSTDTEVTFEVGGTSTEGIDYGNLSPSFTFQANQSSVTLPVTIISDDLVEGDETVIVTLISSDNPDVRISLTNSAVITITDNDEAALSVVATTQSSENETDGSFTINSDNILGKPVEVSFTVGGTAEIGVDYTSLGTSITFPANTSSVTLPVPVIADDLVEGEETVVVTLTGTDHPDVLVGVTDAATVTITDDDQATLSISSTTQSLEDATDGLFTLSTDKQFASSVEVSFTVGGTAEIGVDYTSLGTSITFAANTSSVTLPVPVIADDLVEGEETVVVTLTGTDHPDVLVGVTDAATVTITDDDQATLSISSTTQSSEDATDGLFTISTDKQFASSVEVSFTVGGTAEIGVDYTSLGTSITFAANTSSVTLPVPVIADDLVEGEETVVVTLTDTDKIDASIGTADEAILTISDNDQATLSVIATNQSAEDTMDGLFTINSDKMFSRSVLVDVMLGGTADNGVDYSLIETDILFPANSSSVDIPLLVISDDLQEGDETVILSLIATNNNSAIIGSLDFAVITITDDDEAPVIGPLQSFSIAENSANSSVVGTVNVTDGDVGTVFRDWMIVTGNNGDVFSIGSDNGQITVSNSTNLDFERLVEYDLEIVVSDGSNNSEPQTVRIIVDDLNDNVPTVASDQTFEVAETAASGTVVGTVQAQDGDANTDFGDWSISSGNASDLFALNSENGVLTINDPEILNYEVTSQYTLEIQVSDGLNVSEIQGIVIEVIDVNDPPTAIILNNASFYAFDEINTVIGNLMTLDEDDSNHAYTVIENEDFLIEGSELRNSVVFTNKIDSVVTLTIGTEDEKGSGFEDQFEITVFAFLDLEAPDIRNVSNPGFYEIGSGPLTLEATVTDFALDDVVFNYKRLSEDDFLSVPVTGTNQVFGAKIDDEMVGSAAGIEFFFEASDTSSNVSKSDTFKLAIRYPNFGENSPKVVLDNNRFGQDISNYQVISIPYILNDNDSRVDVLFDEYGGVPDNVNWRMIKFNNDTQDIEDLDGSYQIQLGEGYFFIAKDQKEITIENAISNTQESMTISLKENWNLIGNPYSIDINWPSVLANNNDEVVGPIRVIDPSNPAGWPESTTLKAFEGAFLFALEDVDIEVDFKNTDKRILNTYIQPSYEWFVPLMLFQANSSQEGGVGMHKQALLTFDKFDSPTLPKYFKYLDLNFPHPEHSYGRLSRDIVGVEDSYIWEFQAESNLSGKAHLEWPVPSDSIRQLWLLDVNHGYLMDMKAINRYEFDLNGFKKFKIFYSNDPNEVFVGDQIYAGEAYPNPFEYAFVIPLNLPDSKRSYEITIDIFDLFGKKLERKEYKLDPGRHNLKISIDKYAKNGLMIYEMKISGNNAMKYIQKKILKGYE